MKTTIKNNGIVLLAILFCGACSGEMFTLKETGDIASIKLQYSGVFSGELLTMNNSLIYVVVDAHSSHLPNYITNRLIGIPFKSVESIKVEDYANKRWVTPWLAFQVVPSIIFIGTALSYAEDGSPAFLALLPTGLTGLVLSLSSKTVPGWHRESEVSREMSSLRKYMRYPQGLTRAQLTEVAGIYDQKRPQILK